MSWLGSIVRGLSCFLGSPQNVVQPLGNVELTQVPYSLTPAQQEVQNFAPNVELPNHVIDRILDARETTDRFQNFLLRNLRRLRVDPNDETINNAREASINGMREFKDLDKARVQINGHLIREKNRNRDNERYWRPHA